MTKTEDSSLLYSGAAQQCMASPALSWGPSPVPVMSIGACDSAS